MTTWTTVTTAEELTKAVADGVPGIAVDGTIEGMPSLTLAPGTQLRGGRLRFGGRGVGVTTDNTVSDITIETSLTEAALFTDTSVASWGTLELSGVSTVGQIALIAEGRVRSGHIVTRDVHVVAADVRGRFHRPHAFGVDALQGAFTLWNRQNDASSRFTAVLEGISAGTADVPVRGSGVFVGGSRDAGGEGAVAVSLLTTGEIHTDGGIAPGTPDVISGGVFVIGGATVDLVDNLGTVTTNGQNDMVLDNWGEVGTWRSRETITSRGPSGIGFVNFGRLGTLQADGAIETYGAGSRGFNLYDGSIQEAHFLSISTAGDGAIGVQLSRPLPVLTVSGDIVTRGSTGISLVKGQQISLPAMALSIKPGGSIERLDVGGAISSAGAELATVELLGPVASARVARGIHATGPGSIAVRAEELPASFREITMLPGFGEPSATAPMP
ncbi:hypothetical protein [Leifsonia poae]|uniref:hypothetical protein n=1 Tax=Leifsonia poae TaxID=110933 RepID=UPI001CBE07FA|nr:hypothetical protein [Leifsonia poae]